MPPDYIDDNEQWARTLVLKRPIGGVRAQGMYAAISIITESERCLDLRIEDDISRNAYIGKVILGLIFARNPGFVDCCDFSKAPDTSENEGPFEISTLFGVLLARRRYECRGTRKEQRVTIIFPGIDDSIVGIGGSEKSAMVDWEKRFQAQFLRVIEDVARTQAWETHPTWKKWDRIFGLKKFEPIQVSFYGQFISVTAGSVLVRWLYALPDELVELAAIPGSEKVRELWDSTAKDGEIAEQENVWFSLSTVQRLDTHEIACILDCIIGDPPRTKPLSAEERRKIINSQK